MAELGTEVHVHILLQNLLHQTLVQQQNLQHQEPVQIHQPIQQLVMFGLIEEIYTTYSIDSNNESAQVSTFFVHKKTGIIISLFRVLYSQFEVDFQLVDLFLLKDILSQVLSTYKHLKYGMAKLLFFLHFLIE